MPDWVDKAYNLKNMTTTDKILDILESMTTGSDAMLRTVIHGSSFDANVRLDRKPTPAAILYMAKGFEIEYESGMRYDKTDIEVFFCDRVELGAKGEVVQGVLDSVEPAIDEFLSLVFAEKSWRVEGKVAATTAIGKFDCNVAGYSVQMTLVDRQGRCL